jgi:hypothetical protein
MAWTISVAQLELRFGAFRPGFYHNILVLRDDEGRYRGEINGGPVRPDGRLIANNDQDASVTDFVGSRPLGVQADTVPFFYRDGLPETAPVRSGSEAEIRQLWNTAIACGNEITAQGRTYVATPIPGLAANSNSVIHPPPVHRCRATGLRDRSFWTAWELSGQSDLQGADQRDQDIQRPAFARCPTSRLRNRHASA